LKIICFINIEGFLSIVTLRVSWYIFDIPLFNLPKITGKQLFFLNWRNKPLVLLLRSKCAGKKFLDPVLGSQTRWPWTMKDQIHEFWVIYLISSTVKWQTTNTKCQNVKLDFHLQEFVVYSVGYLDAGRETEPKVHEFGQTRSTSRGLVTSIVGPETFYQQKPLLNSKSITQRV
jgi:hypothetical protein